MGWVSNFQGLRDRWKAVKDNLPAIMGEVTDQKEAELAELQRKQLRSGKGSDGRYLLKYTDDPYFKTVEAALRYQRWKSRISPDKSKPPEYADFFIIGYRHGTIFAQKQGTSIFFGASSRFESSIFDKTKGKDLGLNEESRLEAWRDIYRDDVIVIIARDTGATLK